MLGVLGQISVSLPLAIASTMAGRPALHKCPIPPAYALSIFGDSDSHGHCLLFLLRNSAQPKLSLRRISKDFTLLPPEGHG